MLKRIVMVLVAAVALQMFFVNSAMADDKDEKRTEKKKKDYKWVYFASLPVYHIFAHTLIHESSHALATAINPDWSIKKFKPYPHRLEDGSRVLGSVTSSPDNKDAWKGKTGLVLMSAAPYITDTVGFVTSDILLSTGVVKPNSIAGRVLFFAGMAIPWWDLSYNLILPTQVTDAANIAMFSGVGRRWVTISGLGLSFVGVWRLAVNYYKVFPSHSKKQSEKKSNLVVVPIMEKETLGLSALMHF